MQLSLDIAILYYINLGSYLPTGRFIELPLSRKSSPTAVLDVVNTPWAMVVLAAEYLK
jgi:hypothetical protein